MFRSKLFWGILLGVATSVLLFEGRIHLGYSPLWGRVSEALSVPGTHFANTIFPSGIPEGSWEKVWSGLAIACNFVVYAVFWYLCLWVAGSFREREHPYDRQITLGPPSLR
jgi:hypothetical protein